jgi:hypothetical protein
MEKDEIFTYFINTNKQQSRTIEALVIIISIIIIVFIICIIIYYINRNKTVTYTPPLQPVETENNFSIGEGPYAVGATYNNLKGGKEVSSYTENECEGENIIWENGCKCKKNYYDPFCTSQIYSNNYVSLGILSQPDRINYTVLNMEENKFLTYNDNFDIDENSCTSLCDSRTDCQAVRFSKNDDIYFCELIKDITIEGGQNFIYVDDTIYGSGIYIKKGNSINIEDQVFLFLLPSQYSNLPINWWIKRDEIVPNEENQRNGLVMLSTENTEAVPLIWRPNTVVQTGQGVVGVWSLYDFNSSSFSSLYRQGNNENVYVDNITDTPIKNIQLPSNFNNAPIIYVMYRKLDMLKSI